MPLVDAKYWFIWDLVGALVKAHDSTLLQSTDLCKIIVGGEMIHNVVQQLEYIEIPLFCVTEPSRCEYLC